MTVKLTLTSTDLDREAYPPNLYLLAVALGASTTGALPLAVLPFDGAAVELYCGEPGEWLVVMGALLASDQAAEAAGERLGGARHVLDGTGLAAALAAGDGLQVGVGAHLAAEAIGAARDLLTRGGDVEVGNFGRAYSCDPWPEGEVAMVGTGCIFHFALEASGEAAAAPAPEPESWPEPATEPPAPTVMPTTPAKAARFLADEDEPAEDAETA